MENKKSETLLEVKNLKKYFKTPGGMLHAVDDVSFRIQRGRTLGVVGESGCGKSTLGRTLLCLNEPTAGEILFQGTDIAKLGKKQMKAVRPKMQMIFQDPYSSLNGRMTVRQLIAIIRLRRFVPSAATTARDNRIGGTQANTSMIRQITLSTTPPK